MKIRISKGGGEDPPQSLTPQQRREWNAYIDFLDKKGYKGSPLLDKKETGLATGLFNQFKKENPNTTISLDHVKAVQSEMEALAQNVRGFEARRGNPNADKLMQGTSKIDNWPGRKTTSFKFPDMDKTTYNNSVLTSRQNLGILNPQLKPSDTASARALQPTIPSGGLKLEKMADGKLYYQNRDGDWIIYNQ